MRIKRKVLSRAGFTLAETLLAVLILLLVTSIVMAGIPVAQNAYEKVILGSNGQLLLSTAVNALRSELGTARDILPGADGKSVTYFSADNGAKSRIYMGTDSQGKAAVMIQNYIQNGGLNDVTGGTVGAEHTLLSEATVTTDLRVEFQGITVEGEVVTFKNLAVYHDATMVASLSDSGSSDLVIRSFSAGEKKA